MKILFTGLSGFIGTRILPGIEKDHEIWSFSRPSSSKIEDIQHIEGDLKNPRDIHRAIETVKPETIILMGAISSLYEAEKDTLETHLINTSSVEHFIRSANKLMPNNIPRIIFFSTDLVYDGYEIEKPEGYKETDPPHPKSKYARSKLEAEHLLNFYSNSLILRIALTYGPPETDMRGYVASLVTAIKNNNTINLFQDEWRTPIHVDGIATALTKLINLKNLPQIIHLSGTERLSRVQLGYKLINQIQAGYINIDIKLRQDSPTGKIRGIDCSLGNQLLQSKLALKN
jgi:dTDP-4-dehydrorhamnose reductase